MRLSSILKPGRPSNRAVSCLKVAARRTDIGVSQRDVEHFTLTVRTVSNSPQPRAGESVGCREAEASQKKNTAEADGNAPIYLALHSCQSA